MSFTVEREQAGERLDVFVARAVDISRSRAASLIEEGAVSVCGERRQIRFYIEAVRRMETDYSDFFLSSKKTKMKKMLKF